MAKPWPRNSGAHVHALDLAVVAADQLDAATSGRRAVGAEDEERHIFGQQLVDAVAVTACGRIERFKEGVELGDQADGSGRVRAFTGDGDGQRQLLLHVSNGKACAVGHWLVKAPA